MATSLLSADIVSSKPKKPFIATPRTLCLVFPLGGRLRIPSMGSLRSEESFSVQVYQIFGANRKAIDRKTNKTPKSELELQLTSSGACMISVTSICVNSHHSATVVPWFPLPDGASMWATSWSWLETSQLVDFLLKSILVRLLHQTRKGFMGYWIVATAFRTRSSCKSQK